MAVKYSKQSQKTGATIGTVISVPKPSNWNSSSDDWQINANFPGWLECDGSSLNPNNYYALYQIIGTTYGGTVTGTYPNLTGTFNLPNYRAKYLTGTGKSDGNIAGSATLTPTVGSAGGTPIDVTYPGGTGGVYVISEFRQQTPTQLDTFQLVSKKSRGFENVTTEFPITLSGTVTQNFGPFTQTQLYSAPYHTHDLSHSQLISSKTAQYDSSSGLTIGAWAICCQTSVNGGILPFRRIIETSSPGTIPLTTKHSHLISVNTSATAKAWGHDAEGGNTGISSGAVGYGNTATKTINLAELGTESNPGTFTLSTSSTIRTLFDSRVTTNLTSAETISMMQPYYRNKYIIKAF
jgi:hypothetical protein